MRQKLDAIGAVAEITTFVTSYCPGRKPQVWDMKIGVLERIFSRRDLVELAHTQFLSNLNDKDPT